MKNETLKAQISQIKNDNKDPDVMVAEAIELVSRLLDHSQPFCCYLDQHQNIRGINNESDTELDESTLLDIIVQLRRSPAQPLMLSLPSRDYYFYPLRYDDKTFGFLAVSGQSAYNQFPMTEYLEELGVSLGELMLQKSELRRVKHQQRLNSLGVLLGGITHDFNHVLFGMMSMAELILRENRGENEKIARYAKLIEGFGASGKQLTSKILSYSRKEEPETLFADLHQAIDGAILLVTQGSRKNVNVQQFYLADDPRIKCDPRDLENMFVNLLINSVQATEKIQSEIEVTTGKDVLGADDPEFSGNPRLTEAISIRISDNGTGIRDDLLHQIFEPHFTTFKHKDATGFGLTLVYDMIKQQHGNISVKNLTEGGVEFSVFFPQVKATMPLFPYHQDEPT